VRQPTEPSPWLTTRRGDLISLWGAAVVVLLVFVVALVIVREAGSDPAADVPPMPFYGSTTVQQQVFGY
jgi:hypothetical protein